MKHILALFIGLLILSIVTLIVWLLATHPEIIAGTLGALIVLVFAYGLGWKVINEFMK